MTSQNAEKPPAPSPSGIKTVLRYTGIPPSWLDKRPKLPSRNWLIFLSVTSSIAGLYIYDRRQCKQVKQSYIDRVKHFAEEPLAPFDKPRKVMVYGCKWPGDEDYDQGLKYFRKYVKPILVAAAVDFEMVKGKRHGELSHLIANEVRKRRRIAAGLDSLSPVELALPTYGSPAVARQRELDGGIVIIGRPTLKEYMHGLKRGWTEGLDEIDRDEILAQELQLDGHFDEPADVGEDAQPDTTSNNLHSAAQNSPIFSPVLRPPPLPQKQTQPPSSIPASINTPPTSIPALPPILFVTFTNYIGFTQIPIMIWEFFNQRHKVRSGAEEAYRLIMKNSRPIEYPSTGNETTPLFGDIAPTKMDLDEGDFGYDKHVESFYKRSLESIPADIQKARKKYYDALPEKLATARALARGTREPTKDEKEFPPPTEVELGAERLKKEQRWRNDLEGWEIIKPSARVTWDDRFRDALRLFVNPSPGETKFGDITSER